MSADADLFDIFCCANVDNLHLFFDMEVRTFRIVIRLELRWWFIILIYACIILFLLCDEF